MSTSPRPFSPRRAACCGNCRFWWRVGSAEVCRIGATGYATQWLLLQQAGCATAALPESEALRLAAVQTDATMVCDDFQWVKQQDIST